MKNFDKKFLTIYHFIDRKIEIRIFILFQTQMLAGKIIINNNNKQIILNHPKNYISWIKKELHKCIQLNKSLKSIT